MIKKILINQWLTSIFVSLISFVTTIYIARELGPTSFGKYSSLIALGAILSIIIDGGFKNIILNNELKNYSDKKNIIKLAVNHIILSSLIIILIISLFSSEALLYNLCILYFFGINCLQLISTILKGRGLYNSDAYIQICTRLLLMIFSMLVVYLFKDIELLLISSIIVLFFMLYHSRKYITWGKCYCNILETYQVTSVFFCIDICITIYIRSSIIIMQLLGISDADIGGYTSAFRIIEGLIMLSIPIGFVVRKSIFKSDIFIKFFLYKYIIASLIFGLFLATINIYFGDKIVLLIYGQKYELGGYLIKFFYFFIIFIFSNAILNQYLVGLNLLKKSLYIYIISTFINVSLNYFLIQDYGVLGAIWASSLTEFLIFVLMLILILKNKNVYFAIKPNI